MQQSSVADFTKAKHGGETYKSLAQYLNQD